MGEGGHGGRCGVVWWEGEVSGGQAKEGEGGGVGVGDVWPGVGKGVGLEGEGIRLPSPSAAAGKAANATTTVTIPRTIIEGEDDNVLPVKICLVFGKIRHNTYDLAQTW